MLRATFLQTLVLLLSLLCHYSSTLATSPPSIPQDFAIEISTPTPSKFNIPAPPSPATCENSASIALRKWRRDCDRSPYQKIKSHCWGRAPSVHKCCPESASKTTSCKAFWPKDEHEARQCHLGREGYCDLLEQGGERCVSEARCARTVGDATFCFCRIPGCLACTGM